MRNLGTKNPTVRAGGNTPQCLPDSKFPELGQPQCRDLLPRRRRQGPMDLRAEQQKRHRACCGPDSTRVSSPWARLFRKHLPHDCRLLPYDFHLLYRVGETGDPLQHTNIVDDLKNIQEVPRFEQLREALQVPNYAFGCLSNTAHPRRARF